MGYVKNIIQKFLRLQDMFYPDTKEYFDQGEGKVSQIRVVGVDGETVLLKVNGTRIVEADENDIPQDVFRCTADTFLDVLSGDMALREAITRGHFTIENAKTARIDIIECEKWSKAFAQLHGLISKQLATK